MLILYLAAPWKKSNPLRENNALIKEIIRCTFEKTKVHAKVFDAETLIAMIENSVDAFLAGKQQ